LTLHSFAVEIAASFYIVTVRTFRTSCGGLCTRLFQIPLGMFQPKISKIGWNPTIVSQKNKYDDILHNTV